MNDSRVYRDTGLVGQTKTTGAVDLRGCDREGGRKRKEDLYREHFF